MNLGGNAGNVGNGMRIWVKKRGIGVRTQGIRLGLRENWVRMQGI